MPGARLRTFTMGDRNELLVEFILSTFSFTTPVPRQVDVGHDIPDVQVLARGRAGGGALSACGGRSREEDEKTRQRTSRHGCGLPRTGGKGAADKQRLLAGVLILVLTYPPGAFLNGCTDRPEAGNDTIVTQPRCA